MDGGALTAKELSYIAEVTPQTASEHLAKLSKPNPLILTETRPADSMALGSKTRAV